MYSFEYELNDDDYLDFNRYHAYNAPGQRNKAIVSRFVFPIFFMVFAFFYARMLDNHIVPYVGFGILSIVWIVFFHKYADWRLRRFIAALKKTGKLPYHQKTSIRFEDDMIVEHTDSTDVQTKYSAIERVCSGENAVYLYFSATQAFIIPFRAFANTGGQQQLLDFVSEKASL